jgi:hypothetical protein
VASVGGASRATGTSTRTGRKGYDRSGNARCKIDGIRTIAMKNPRSKLGENFKLDPDGVCNACNLAIALGKKGEDPQRVKVIAISKSDGGIVNAEICAAARVLLNPELATFLNQDLLEVAENGSGVFHRAALLSEKQFREVEEFQEYLAEHKGRLPKNISEHHFSDLKGGTVKMIAIRRSPDFPSFRYDLYPEFLMWETSMVTLNEFIDLKENQIMPDQNKGNYGKRIKGSQLPPMNTIGGYKDKLKGHFDAQAKKNAANRATLGEGEEEEEEEGSDYQDLLDDEDDDEDGVGDMGEDDLLLMAAQATNESITKGAHAFAKSAHKAASATKGDFKRIDAPMSFCLQKPVCPGSHQGRRSRGRRSRGRRGRFRPHNFFRAEYRSVDSRKRTPHAHP